MLLFPDVTQVGVSRIPHPASLSSLTYIGCSDFTGPYNWTILYPLYRRSASSPGQECLCAGVSQLHSLHPSPPPLLLLLLLLCQAP